jgi:RNA polymerase sigma-70 factor (ECF subfamily)
MSYQNDADLLIQLKNGNANAFTMLYVKYQLPLFMEAYNKIRHRQEAEDIVQEIFTSLWQRRQVLAINIPLKHYLYRAVHLQFAHKCRHNRVTREFATYAWYQYMSGEGIPRQRIENKELGQQIRMAINSISAPACRKVFEMLYLEDKSRKEIATDLNIRPQVVKNQACRALKVIRTHLQQVV